MRKKYLKEAKKNALYKGLMHCYCELEEIVEDHKKIKAVTRENKKQKELVKKYGVENPIEEEDKEDNVDTDPPIIKLIEQKFKTCTNHS